MRPGTVLVACVVLVVLLAVIGLVFCTSATDARVAARQHTSNTQITLLADGLLEVAGHECVRDLFENNAFRPEHRYLTCPAGDTASDVGQRWLASRLPDVPSRPAPARAGGNPPCWRYLSAPLLGSQFDSPYRSDGESAGYTLRQWALPDAVRLADGSWHPALRFVDPQTGGITPPVLAADADGDGIADSGLVKLTGGQIEGITYYGAVRIIDNNSALNASVAWEPNPVTDPAGGLPGDFFPTNIDLRDIVSPAEMAALTEYRSGGARASALAFADEQDGTGQRFASARSDFAFSSPQEALWMQLGRRLSNPGFISSQNRYQALGVTDSMSVAHSFCLPLRNVYPTLAEQLLPLSTARTGRDARGARYAAWDVAGWFNDQFAFRTSGSNVGPSARPLRAILTARNPVSNFCPSKFNDKGKWRAEARYTFGDMVRHNNRAYVCVRSHVAATGDPPGTIARPLTWVAEPWTSAPTKTGVNTADFLRLWLAYWSLMVSEPPRDAAGGMPPTGLAQDGTGLRMFRSSLRSDARLSGSQEMLLRAAIAAVNTLQLRSADFCTQTGLGTVISRTVDLPGSSGEPQYDVTVYGADRQPFITEVFARNDGNPQDDYVAIELFNPYPQPLVLRGWALATAARAILPSGGPPRMRLSAVDSTLVGPTNWSAAPPVVPAGGYLVLASADVPPPNVTAQPDPSVLRVVPDLLRALGQELVLVRPRRGDGTPSRSADPNDPLNAFDEEIDSGGLADRIPVDAYDFTNLSPAAFALPTEWHYVRPSDSTRGKAWHYVYPGPVKTGGSIVAAGPTFLGTHVSRAADTSDLSSLGRADSEVLEPAVYHDLAVELNGTGFPGPFKPTASGPNRFPFGSFARNGDILDVPFIGAYCVRQAASDDHRPTSFVELNPATVDSAFADDDDPDDDVNASGMPVEQIGHFCPIDGADLSGPDHADDFGPDPAQWRYHWAMHLFDYLTVQCPQDDYLPDVDPATSDLTVPPAPSPMRYPPAGADATLAPQPVANVVPNAANAEVSNPNQLTEETASLEGLVNLNTAPWRVLAAVPWLPPPAAPNQKPRWLADNARIAQAIVDYRDGKLGHAGHGPFRTIFELNRVELPDGTRLRDVLGNTATTVFGPEHGRLAPYENASDNDMVRGGFMSRFLFMTRVSNLVTTRSDSFMAYVLVQGWRDADTASPRLVSERRLAALVDRTGVTPLNPCASIVRVPTD